MRARLVAALLACALGAATLIVVLGPGARSSRRAEAVAPEPPTTALPTTALPTTTLPPTTLPPPTTATTSTTVAAPKPTYAAVAAGRDLRMYGGLGTWLDVYDWSVTYNKGSGRVEPADVDRMAKAGMQTLYVQTSKWDAPDDVLEQARLEAFIARAKANHLAVVAWYLPTYENPQLDMRRLMAAARLPGVDALAMDIESKKVTDVGERNRRLLEISTNLRAALPDMALGAIPFPPVVLDVINPDLWPSFPWRQLAPLYDVWLPMSYQSVRTTGSGYHDAYRYTAENIDRLRAHVGRPDVPVHTIGGIADQTSASDVAGMLRAAAQRRVLGGSLYDWRTTVPDLWPSLQAFRAR